MFGGLDMKTALLDLERQAIDELNDSQLIGVILSVLIQLFTT
jgi:hypothetical protein